MKVHSNRFKQQIKMMGKEIDSKITIGSTVLGKNELNAVTPSYQGALLKSVMKELHIDSNVDIPLNSVLNYKFGVKVNGEYEYLDFGNYVVYKVEKQEDTRSYKITCYDKMLYSMKEYEDLGITYPITIRDYIKTICAHLGLVFASYNDNFANANKEIPTELYLGLGYTFRDVFDELSQVTASTICLNDNDEVEVRYINETNDVIDEEYLKDVNVNFGEKYGKINSIVLSRSSESDNVYLRDEESVANDGLCELKIIDNQIMNFNNRDEFLPEILGKLNGLEYYLNDFTSTGITYYDVCDRYTVKIGDNTYSCVMFNDEILITQGLEENVYTEMPEETQTDYTKADKTDRKINQTYIIVDKQNQQIETVVSQTDEQNQKIAKVTQTVDELNSKISDIADITISAEDNDAEVEFENINQSEPIRLVIRPIGESISYDYPREDYPQEDFSKIRTIRFTNTKTEEVFDYVLPMDLLYYDSEHYDEFILDYEGQTCMVNKRVGYNADGTTYVLDNEKIIECDEYPRILLTEGDYKVQVLDYDTAYIFVRLMAQNIYTTQFYTKSETDSIISQTSQNIDLSVNKKLSNYSTTTQMNSAIQLSANGITSSVSENYATKNELNNTTNSINSKIEQTANSITSSVSSNYATKSELNSAKSEIKQTTDSISSTVSKKIGSNEVVSSINQSAEQITLNSNRLVVNSNNFKLTKEGNLTCTNANVTGTINSSNANITGGKLDISAPYSTSIITLKNNNNSNEYITISPRNSRFYNQDGNSYIELSNNGVGSPIVATKSSNARSNMSPGIIEVGQGNTTSTIYHDEIITPILTQTSLKENKKNFELFTGALEIIEEIDLYKYNLKQEKDDSKKHIGFVIGDGFRYSKEVTSTNKEGKEIGVDNYSMTSLCLQAIKEQQELIKKLEEKINNLERTN